MNLNMRSFRPVSVTALTLASLLFAGCGGGGGGGNGSGGGSGNNGGSGGGTLSVSAIEANGLTATLSEDKNTVSVGGTVTYTMTLANKTASAVLIQFSASTPTQPPAAVVVRDAAGNLVFTPVPPAPPLDTLSLGPGQALTVSQAVAAFSAAGTYSAKATFSDGPGTTIGPLTVTAH